MQLKEHLPQEMLSWKEKKDHLFSQIFLLPYFIIKTGSIFHICPPLLFQVPM
jgi:hypothetical protein